MPMDIVRNMSLAAVVRAYARQLADECAGARWRTLGGGTVRDTLEVARDVAKRWIRGAYEIGYRDGVEDVIRALGWDGDWRALEAEIKNAARVRDAMEKRVAEEA